MDFQRQDLEGTHYYWDRDENDVFNGQPSRRAFDVFNGNQVLFVINFYGSESENFTVQDAKNVEQRILHELPPGLKSEISVYNWLKTSVLSL